MQPQPVFETDAYKAAGKLKGKTAIITGGDSGIGRAVAVAYAKEGCNVCIVYLNEHEDAKAAQAAVDAHGVKSLLLTGDVGEQSFCKQAVQQRQRSLASRTLLSTMQASSMCSRSWSYYGAAGYAPHSAPTCSACSS